MDDLLKERITALKTERDRSREALARARGNVKAKSEVTKDAVARFAELMRQKIQEGDTPACKAWLSSTGSRSTRAQFGCLAGKMFWNSALWLEPLAAQVFALWFRSGALYGSRTRLSSVKG